MWKNLLPVAGVCLGCALSAAAGEPQQPMKLQVQIKVELQYLLYLPQEYEQKEDWPLLLFLHGAGERGDNLELVKVHGPPKLIAQGKQFPFIVVSPQCPAEGWWQPHELLALLDHVQARYKVDPKRVYVTGLSMGGYGTWALAGHAPQRFAAAVPICGGGTPYLARRLVGTPVWAFHGAKDTAVPVSASAEMVHALKSRGGDVRFTIYPEAGHDAWTATYENPELYEWLLAQRRQ